MSNARIFRTLKPLLRLLVLLLVMGCSHYKRPPNNPDPNPPIEDPDLTPATLITSAGHGAVFDPLGRPIELNAAKADEILSSMCDVLWHDAIKQFNYEDRENLRSARALLKSKEVELIDKALVQSAIVDHLLRRSPEELQKRYGWRHRILLFELHSDYLERIELLPEEAIRLGISDIMDFTDSGGSSDYVNKCRSGKVPIPPPWSESSSAWKYHGTLQTKLIASNLDAHVWTYGDPQLRGGCIALPRGTGASGSVAGIICQSATTGKACFWDNILPGGTTSNIGWKGLTLNVNNLTNGDNLRNCTSCHRGNNVFLISPDDTTWAKVIRPVLQSNVGQNFTTHIENTSIPRYIPVSSNAEWVNPEAPACVGCHERPAVGGFSAPSPMPPDCKTSATDSGKCYGVFRRWISATPQGAAEP